MADALINSALEGTQNVLAEFQGSEKIVIDEEIRVATITKFLFTVLAPYDNDPELIFAVAGRAIDRLIQETLAAAK